MIKAILVSKKYGLSATALSPLGVRWIMHELGVREDEALKKMIFNIPSVAEFGMKISMFPVIWASRISGYVPGILTLLNGDEADVSSMINARTRFFDEVFEEHKDDIEQVVISGAGFDTRIIRFFGKKRIRTRKFYFFTISNV